MYQLGGLWGVAVDPATGRVYVTSGFEGPNGNSSIGPNLIQVLPANLTGAPQTIYTYPFNTGSLTGMTIVDDGSIWAVYNSSTTWNNQPDQLIHLTTTGTVLGTYNIPPPTATSGTGSGNAPFDIAMGPDGALYIATFFGPCVLKFNPATNQFSSYIPNVPNVLAKV